MSKFLKSIFSVEFSFIMFAFSGAFKESLNIGIDLTSLFLAITVLLVVKRKIMSPTFKKYEVVPMIFYGFFLILFLISFLTTPSVEPAVEKIIKFILLTSPTFLLPIFIIRDKESLNRTFNAILIVSTFLSILSVPSILQKGSSLGFIGFNEGNYQGLARINGLGIIVAMFKIVSVIIPIRSKPLYIIAFSVISFSLIGTGSRMPLIAVGIIIAISLYNSIKIRKGIIYYQKSLRIVAPIIVLVAGGLYSLYKSGFLDTIIYRFSGIFAELSGSSGRSERVEVSLNIFKSQPYFGGGVGSFSLNYNGLDITDYPHNIFLEFLTEFGIVGFLLFSIFIIAVIWTGLRKYKLKNGEMDYLQITLLSLFAYFLLNSMVSEDINGNRMIFFFGTCLLLSPYLKSRGENNLKKEKVATL